MQAVLAVNCGVRHLPLWDVVGLKMLNSHRTFVDAVKKYCAGHGIAVESRSQGWLLILQRGTRRHFAFGYDVGLNSAVAHRIASDKAATADVLQLCGVPCVPHTLVLNPGLNQYVAPSHPWETMLRHLRENPKGLVVKPNEGTSGELVFMVTGEQDLELAAHRIFSANASLALSPYLDIENEVRVVLLDHQPVVVYEKNRPSVVGDGKHSLLELALAATPIEARAAVLSGIAGDLDRAALDRVLPMGQRQILNWRHNLDSGAQPVVLEQGATRDACVEMAINAAKAIGIRFGSIDVVQVGGGWQILEINSGVMMEALSKRHPDLAYAAYSAALDKVFG
jgi:glutathione synthase/RimK-type ligase-like ATP-grasp enzyme